MPMAHGDERIPQQRPNIVLFLVDDMGWQDTSVPFHRVKTDFNKRYRTWSAWDVPGLERLQKAGMRKAQWLAE